MEGSDGMAETDAENKYGKGNGKARRNEGPRSGLDGRERSGKEGWGREVSREARKREREEGERGWGERAPPLSWSYSIIRHSASIAYKNSATEHPKQINYSGSCGVCAELGRADIV
jgi:hypothetical protein